MTRTFWIALLITALVLSACSRSSKPLYDDFSDAGSGWGAGATVHFTRGYEQGKYYMRVDTNNHFTWTSAGEAYQDVRASVNAISEEARDNTYGLLCRADQGRFYYFAISADGFYGIYRGEADGKLTLLTGPAMQRHPAIRTDGAANRLEAHCEGSRLTLVVNGVTLATVEDDTLRRGQIGLAAGKGRDTRPAIIWFDDLEVKVP